MDLLAESKWFLLYWDVYFCVTGQVSEIGLDSAQTGLQWRKLGDEIELAAWTGELGTAPRFIQYRRLHLSISVGVHLIAVVHSAEVIIIPNKMNMKITPLRLCWSYSIRTLSVCAPSSASWPIFPAPSTGIHTLPRFSAFLLSCCPFTSKTSVFESGYFHIFVVVFVFCFLDLPGLLSYYCFLLGFLFSMGIG